jgi:uncharacterized SAM-binding protein YcdF (DUF218 family)
MTRRNRPAANNPNRKLSNRRTRRHWHSQSGGIIGNLVSLIVLILLLAALYVARGPLLRLTASTWIVEDPLTPSDAIIVLSDDNFFADRATRASELFRQHLAPGIVASGRRLRPTAGIAELMEHDLIERGVPQDRILRFPHDADNTKEEAEALVPLVAQHHWHSVIVVTSNYHTRRARYILQKVFPKEVTVRMASARDGDFDPDHWWEHRKSVKEFVRELAAMVVATWELRNESTHKPAASSGSNQAALPALPVSVMTFPETIPGQPSISIYTV